MRRFVLVVCIGLLFGLAQEGRAFRLINACESPSLSTGSFHVVIAAYESRNCFSQYLWELGVSNAHVFVYRRESQERPLRQWHGPCGISVHERLLLPNHGRENAAFHDYVVEHYKSPPLAVVFLHGHGPNAYHTDCETLVGRARLFYRGLVNPTLETRAAEFAQHMVTLTRSPKQGDPAWLHSGPIPYTVENAEEDGKAILAQFSTMTARWSVNMTFAGFSSCCATFILPWNRILQYPLGFYQDSLRFAQHVNDDHAAGSFCFEFVVWAWFQEPALTPIMEEAYEEAARLAKQFNLDGCAGEHRNSRC